MAAWEVRLRSAWRQSARASAAAGGGSAELRGALSVYLDAARGTRTDPGRIVVGSGPRVLIAALVAALDAEGGSDRIPVLGLVEPIDPEIRAVARRSGAASLDVPAGRAVLHAAAGVVLVEDDRTALIRLAGPPAPALQGSLAIGRLALLGGLDPLVVPGVTVGWLVVPGSLAPSVTDQVEALDGAPSPVEQRALASWIADGGLDRRLRRLRHALLERRMALESALGDELGGLVDHRGSGPGDPWSWPDWRSTIGVLTALPAAARAVGVAIDPVDDDGRLTLGHAAPSETDLVEAVGRLGRAIDALDPLARRPPPEPPRPIRGTLVEGIFGAPAIRRGERRGRPRPTDRRPRVGSSRSAARSSGGADPQRSRSRVRSGKCLQ